MTNSKVSTLIKNKPLFSRFLKETGLRNAYLFNVAQYNRQGLEETCDDSLISGTFLWGAKDTMCDFETWSFANKMWQTYIIPKIRQGKKIDWKLMLK